jgi:serine/threonine protein phosphatase 1
MGITYAIPDLHGRFDLLCAAELAIADRAGDACTTTVILGDFVDRGPQSAQVIEHLRRGLNRRSRLICVKGNHDALMLDALRDPANLPRWLRNGGISTLRSYGHFNADAPDVSVVPDSHREWLERLQLMHVDEHRIFVHGGVDPALPLDRQDENRLLRMHYPEDSALGYGAHHVVHGHQPFQDGPKLFSGRTNLDTLAFTTGRLVIGVFDDDMAGGPIDLIEVNGPPFSDAS